MWRARHKGRGREVRLIERAGAGLPTAAAEHHHGERADHDPEVLEHRLASNVLEIVPDLPAHVVHGRIIALVDLGPAGDSGSYALASWVAFDLLAQVHEDIRLLGSRPDHVHVAFEHVEELRQLVEPEPTQDTADGCDALVVSLRPHLLPVVPGRA